jgi:competence protein ComEA
MRHRAAVRVSAAYSTAYGHPSERSGFAPVDDQPGRRRRWALTPALAAVASVVVLALAGIVGWMALRDGAQPVPVQAAAAVSETAAAPAQETPSHGTEGSPAPGTEAVVHVAGQVVSPGLVTVAHGARVADAIAAAGGPLEGADLSVVNLARVVVDGEQILIPLPGEAVTPPGGTHDATGGGQSGGLIDLNRADAATLDELPGVGPVLAERIVAWRTENGPFTSVDELGEVSGIGPSILTKIRDLVRI